MTDAEIRESYSLSFETVDALTDAIDELLEKHQNDERTRHLLKFIRRKLNPETAG